MIEPANGRILVAGDTHGNLQHWKNELLPAAATLDCPVILQLGDFGYWEHQKSGRYYLDWLNERCLARDVWVLWIDGNHENHTMLRSQYVDDYSEFACIRDRIWYAPRGMRWTWHGQRFLALGGAYSIDKNWRRPGTSWWPEEELDEEEITRASAGGKCDILVSHDVPYGIDLQLHFAIFRATYLKHDPSCERHRQRVRRVVDATHPRHLLHGHYHVPYNDVLTLDDGWSIKVTSLGCDEMGPLSWTVLNLIEP